MHTAQNSETQN